MARNITLLLPLVLLACDSTPSTGSDTDGPGSTGDTSGTTDDPGTTTSVESTSSGMGTSGVADETGIATETGVADDTGTGDDTGSDEGSSSSGETTGDESSSSTTGEAPMAVCGDGVVEGDEACDDGDANGDYDQCALDCAGPGPFCGDGNTDDEVEQCDDGDGINGNGCNVDCVVSGSMLWELTKTTIGTESNDIGRDVTLMGDGTVRVASQARVGNTLQHVLITDFDQAGNELDEHVHVSATFPTPNLDVGGLHPDGTYNLIRYGLGPLFNGYNVSGRSADHATNDWILDLTDGYTAVRRAGGGGLHVQQEDPGDPSTYFIVGPGGNTVYASPNNVGLRYHTIAELDSDVVLVEEANVGAGFQPTLARFAQGGALQYRTFIDSAYEDVADNWYRTVLGVAADGRVAAVVQLGGNNGASMVAMMLNPDGSLAWETLLEDANAGLHVNGVAIDSEGAVVIAGRRQPGIVSNDGYILKLGSSGEQFWDEQIIGNGYEEVFAVTVLGDDSLVFTGAYSEISGSADIWVARFAP